MTARTRKSTQASPKVEDQQVPAPEETEVPEATEAEATEAEATPEAEPTVEELKAQLEALKAQLAAKPVRQAREVKPTPKQIRFLKALIEHPDHTVPELCTEAGATETSHGFVFRMLEHGYLRVSIPSEVVAKYNLAGSEAEGSEEESEAGSEEQASA